MLHIFNGTHNSSSISWQISCKTAAIFGVRCLARLLLVCKHPVVLFCGQWGYFGCFDAPVSLLEVICK
jgi:hypothetical protein